jgi:GT2 family glycosyltransferase
MVSGISVVIPNYNGVHLFPHTLPTVEEALKNAGKPYEIIIVDDCSTDGSVNFLKQNFSRFRIIVNPKNSGFPVSANTGIFAALYDKVLLLNSDVQLTPTYFNNQFKYFDKPDTFGVMGKIVGWNDDIVQDGAKLPFFHGVKIKTSGNYLLKDENQMRDGLYSMYLSGANSFIDRDKFILLNGFNELFSPFYVEDFELSIRAWRMGFKCYYDYNSVCKHQVSSSIKLKSRKSYVNTIYNRNKLFLHALHLEGIKKQLWFLQLLPETIINFFTFRWYYFKSLWMFFNSRHSLKVSQAKFNEVTKVARCKKSIGEVASFILDNIKGEKIVF